MGWPVLFRCGALLSALAFSLVGSYLFLRLAGEGSLNALDLLRCLLVAISGFWLVWGSAAAVLGVFRRKPRITPCAAPILGRTATTKTQWPPSRASRR